ncbi:LOW QUALITY PROTEIN: Hypothetical protein PHPALM_7256 [Phytophthora palmivora]|uniref:Reverse transcriptase n=1 Tax=Phytophthora palmivora TaxID=4796 RepID=A0A2P4YCU2_9STRA|nr:LOW QUALITY PROTEIN: Hypothetical protein PHPALM_7256 [Phytophthora palmivora]
MVDEVLQNCHNSVEGGHQGIVGTYHRVKSDYYWIGLYADVVRHVQACENCCTSKKKSHLEGPTVPYCVDGFCNTASTNSAGQHTALLLFQDHFTGFVVAKAMAEAFEVAKVFEENVFRRFGAPSLVRHDRDPRFMSDVFQKFSKMMQSRSRSTLSYRPQANGQQERSVKTMIQAVYVEDPLQADWDDIAEKMVYAIKNSRDLTRQETPFYLAHDWDARSTMKAMTESGEGKQLGRLGSSRMAPRSKTTKGTTECQLKENARRAKEHNESLSRVEQQATPQLGGALAESTGNPAQSTKSLFNEGDQVWLVMERVKQGLMKKLAHRWHGPFRVKRKVDEFACELELPDNSGYRFYPVIHVSRLKKVVGTEKRPTTHLITELEEDQRFDVDEELLPQDSWEPDEGASQYEVEVILDDELPLSTSTARNERRFKVKWVDYEEPSWEPLSNLSCG